MGKVKKMKTVNIAAPDGYHWMEYEGGPVLMVGDYVPHEGAAESVAFEVIDEHDPERLTKGAEWDKIYNAILERTGNKELAAATATARTGSRYEKSEEPEKVSKKEKRLLFVVSQPSNLDRVRKFHLCGVEGRVFKEQYLDPLGLERSAVDVIDLGELAEHQDAEPLAVVALGKAARLALGQAADFSLPHPWSIRKSGDKRGELARKFKRIGQLLEKQQSYQPPLGVQDAAARGLMLRAKHGRGGTEVGVARARDLKNGRRVSIDTIKRMVNFFTRHARDLEAPANKNPRDKDYPGAGLVAHLLWGGDPGRRWAEKILRQYEREQTKKAVSIYKADKAKRIVYGVVLDPYIVDAHDDYVSPKEIEETAHNFMISSRTIGLDHNGATEAQVVESWVEKYPSDEDYKKAINGEEHRAHKKPFGDDFVHSGSWILGVKLSPENWAKVQAGELNAFSIGGFGTREPIEASEMPRVEFING